MRALLVVASVMLMSSVFAADPQPPDFSAAHLDAMAARFVPVDVSVDISSLPANEKLALRKMIEAARLLDPLFMANQIRASAQGSSAARRDSSAASMLADDACLDQLLLEWYGNENGDAIVIISHAGTIAHANDRFRSLWQVGAESRLNVEADVWNAVLRLVDEPQTVQDMSAVTC